MINSPVYGVVFLFKWTRETNINHTTDKPKDGTYDTSATENGVFFAAQTIQNACGTQAILSVILNQDNASSSSTSASSSAASIDIGPELAAFKDFTTGFPPDLRGEALSNSEAIRMAHNAFARASPFVDETARAAPDAQAADVYHFIAYTPVNGVLYELDGLQPYPISHGKCNTETFPDKVIDVLQRRIARYPEGETRFNLMAVAKDLRVRARESGDAELLEQEERKRKAWAWENTLRRWNFVGFIGEILKGVVGMKERQGTYNTWVDGAKAQTKKKLEKGRGIGADLAD